ARIGITELREPLLDPARHLQPEARDVGRAHEVLEAARELFPLLGDTGEVDLLEDVLRPLGDIDPDRGTPATVHEPRDRFFDPSIREPAIEVGILDCAPGPADTLFDVDPPPEEAQKPRPRGDEEVLEVAGRD